MGLISTVDNALDSLRRMADDLGRHDDPLAVKGALCWGWHAAALLAYHRLLPAREQFDHWFWAYLEGGEPALDTDRDARWEERQRLSLLQLLDVLSEKDLPILEPQFYQGWQDRTTRCQTLRQRVAEVIGTSIDGATRDRLVVLLAAYHRLLRLPAPVELEVGPLRAELPALLDLVEALVDRSHDHAGEILEAVGACRRAAG